MLPGAIAHGNRVHPNVRLNADSQRANVKNECATTRRDPLEANLWFPRPLAHTIFLRVLSTVPTIGANPAAVAIATFAEASTRGGKGSMAHPAHVLIGTHQPITHPTRP